MTLVCNLECEAVLAFSKRQNQCRKSAGARLLGFHWSPSVSQGRQVSGRQTVLGAELWRAMPTDAAYVTTGVTRRRSLESGTNGDQWLLFCSSTAVSHTSSKSNRTSRTGGDSEQHCFHHMRAGSLEDAVAEDAQPRGTCRM